MASALCLRGQAAQEGCEHQSAGSVCRANSGKDMSPASL